MTEKTYLWYSYTQESNAVTNDRNRPSGRRVSFNAPRIKGFCVYIDSLGDLIKVTQVTHTPDHQTGFTDMRLLDVADTCRCITGNRGTLTPEGEKFCEEKGIRPDYSSLMRYMDNVDATAPYLRKSVSVRKPLQLKT